MSIYDHPVSALGGDPADLHDHAGKVALIVNVASKCGLTPQYEGLERLQETYGAKGFTVLGFPCNQFGEQEPGSADEIKTFCSLTYGVSFPMFEKVEVNGPDAHPLFQFLKTEKRGLLGTDSIKWNFTKFLVDRQGKPVARFAPQAKPEDLEGPIRKLF